MNSEATGNPRHASGQVRDTVEPVVVAFVLAFIFRAFVLEAFVIPTGSMASSLYGEHWTITCSDCGYEYAVGALREGAAIHNTGRHVECPNCGWRGDRTPSARDVESGDRILVLKWPVEWMWVFPDLEPNRWTATVFKDPADGVGSFIKRLVGLPGEVLQLIDGDVYTARADEIDAALRAELEDLLALKIRITQEAGRLDSRRLQALRREYARRAVAVSHELPRYVRIRRKPPAAQRALWRLVYDHDYVPERARAGGPRSPAWFWKSVGSNGVWQFHGQFIRADTRGQDEPAVLQFLATRVNDFCGYNSASPLADEDRLVVSDVRVSTLFVPREGEGYVQFVLSKADDVFVARVEADGTVSLHRGRLNASEPPVLLGQTSIGRLQPGQGLRISVSNVDYRVAVSIDGREVLATTDDQYAPDISWVAQTSIEDRPAWLNRPPLIQIAAQGLSLELRHLRVERDVYYRNGFIGQREPEKRVREPDGRLYTVINPWMGMRGWGTTRNPILLRDWEYYMLGDNSPMSKDSRLWWETGPHLLDRGERFQLGTVPQDQLIGEAFFVYWPAGYRAWWTLGRGVIPNVGQMRWIF